jgi:hypothetical protein
MRDNYILQSGVNIHEKVTKRAGVNKERPGSHEPASN